MTGSDDHNPRELPPLIAGEAAATWPDLAGKMEAGGHRLPVRVYYEDTDFSGFVYHVSYLRWCERGRTDFVRHIGLGQKDLFDGEGEDRRFFVVRRMEVDYLKPALMDDVLEVRTEVDSLGACTVDLNQVIVRDETPLFRAVVTIVLLGGAGRPQRLTAAMKAVFQPS